MIYVREIHVMYIFIIFNDTSIPHIPNKLGKWTIKTTFTNFEILPYSHQFQKQIIIINRTVYFFNLVHCS